MPYHQLILQESVTFEDVAIYFSEKEWKLLEKWQKELYKDVMMENHKALCILGNHDAKPDIIMKIERGEDPYCTDQFVVKGTDSDRENGHKNTSMSEWHIEECTDGCSLQTPSPEKATEMLFHGPDLENTWKGKRSPKNERTSKSGNVEDNSTRHKGRFPKRAQSMEKVKAHRRESLPVCMAYERRLQGKADIKHQRLQRRKKLNPSTKHNKTSRELEPPTGKVRNHATEKHKCDVRLKLFFKAHDFNANMRIDMGEELSKCTQCEKSFIHYSSMVRHHNNHHGEKPYQCTQCEKTFSSNSNLVAHLRTHAKQYPCSECAKLFGSKSNLIAHQRIHTGERPYPCSECDLKFSSNSNLTAHTRIHTGVKPYKCTECEKSFCESSHLKAHHKSHTGEKPHKCAACGKRFSKKSHLTVHNRIHTGKMPHKCTACEKTFSDGSSFLRHQKTHAGQRSYKCTECEKGFSQHSGLVQHQRCHTGEKPYTCNKCEKNFRSASNLRVHMAVHTGERKYQCGTCKKSYSDNTHLKRHQKTHTADGIENNQILLHKKTWKRKTNIVAHEICTSK